MRHGSPGRRFDEESRGEGMSAELFVSDRAMSNELTETLRDAQRLGFFGAAPIENTIDHARTYVTALGELPTGCRIIDLGSGGGLPGLVVAAAYPESRITLIDRREKRTDFLRRATNSASGSSMSRCSPPMSVGWSERWRAVRSRGSMR